MFETVRRANLIDPWNNDSVISEQRTRFVVPVNQPLVLISEVQRSGGTLLTQLLDQHPQLHVHPSELHIGRPNKRFWPKLNLELSADDWFDQLWEHPALLHARDGYSKPGKYSHATLPFLFLGTLQKQLFKQLLEEKSVQSQRDILDAYATSYFNAWLDYAGLYRDPKTVKYWVTFVARVSFDPDNITGFFSDYPDGYFVSVVRDPVSWFASASRYMPEVYGNVEEACNLWHHSTERALAEFQSRPEKVFLVSFEQLVANSFEIINNLCDFLNISPIASIDCIRPTFNGMPISSNSSFDTSNYTVLQNSLDRSKYLADDLICYIRQYCGELHEDAMALIASLGPIRRK
ncbi:MULTISPECIES: sulfotransferase [Methylomonas]|nr:sulfotransferase [Methylomonas koyamae]